MMNAQEAEKLLRRIEVKRLFAQPDESFPLKEIQRISASFMLRSIETEDWRFLNAALKLNDWLRTGGNLCDEMSHQEKETLSRLRMKCGLPALVS